MEKEVEIERGTSGGGGEAGGEAGGEEHEEEVGEKQELSPVPKRMTDVIKQRLKRKRSSKRISSSNDAPVKDHEGSEDQKRPGPKQNLESRREIH